MVGESSWSALHVVRGHYALVGAGGGVVVVVVSVKLCCQESELRASKEVGSLDLIEMADLGLQCPASYIQPPTCLMISW